MTKTEATVTLLLEADSPRVSNTAAKRILAACKALGVETPSEVFFRLGYCNYEGNPFNPVKITKIW